MSSPKLVRGRWVIPGADDAVLPGLINGHHHSKGVSTIQHAIADMLLEPWILSHRRVREGDPRLEALTLANAGETIRALRARVWSAPVARSALVGRLC